LAHSDNGGTSFSYTDVVDSGGSVKQGRYPNIVDVGGYDHITYRSEASLYKVMYVTGDVVGGYGSPVEISDASDTSNSKYPLGMHKAASNIFYVPFRVGNVLYVRSNAGGTGWDDIETIGACTTLTECGMTTQPIGVPHAVWNSGRYLYHSIGGGEWSTPVIIHDNVGSVRCYPELCCDSNGRLHLVWFDYVSPWDRLWYKSMSPGGTWGPAYQVSDNASSTVCEPTIGYNASNCVTIGFERDDWA
ncbi:unnamed protein product, partial [marine sediment metagenome]